MFGVLMALACHQQKVCGQTVDWFTGGNTGLNPATSFLGTADGVPLNFRTDNLVRARLNQTTSYTIGSFGAQVANGYLGLSPNNTLWANGPGPFSRLHLHDGTTAVLQAPYRPWMDNGITFTTNSDQMYIGHKVEPGDDQTAAVIQWGDNDAPSAGPDVLKFLFAAGYSGGAYGKNGLNGLELGRFHPQGFFGLGDWQAAGQQPDERLDLLRGTIRLRDFVHPTLYRNDTYDRLLVANPADGRVYWRPVSSLGDPCASGWTLNGSDPVTAFNGNPCPPQSVHRVGIGTNMPEAKLHVLKVVPNGMTAERGVYARNLVGAPMGFGVEAEAIGSGGTNNLGVRGVAMNAIRNYGVWGHAHATGSQLAHGVYAYGTGGSPIGTRSIASGTGNVTAVQAEAFGGMVNVGLAAMTSGGGSLSVNYGVRAMAGGAMGSTNWAGWFDGKVWVTDSAWVQNGVVVISDGNLKTNVQDLTGSLEKVLQLAPKTYVFQPDVHPELQLPTTPQIGMIAQELEEVIPQAVGTTAYPAQFDTLGNMMSDGFTIKGIDYLKLVPVLVGAIKEQQARITAQDDRLAQLEAALAACCTADAKATDPNDLLNGDGTPALDHTLDRLLLIAPNPFTDHTTVHYTLERPGRAQLLVNSADGRHIAVLHEGVMPAGAHRYEWSTAHLASGVHYVTLLLDGEHVVKRAVKVR
ncbi:MAG: tail fiber domain-containing protein [Flavobacteriales bacterium]|nr:tail fiber domain-containing protein [Flavobacteriales bacterium]